MLGSKLESHVTQLHTHTFNFKNINRGLTGLRGRKNDCVIKVLYYNVNPPDKSSPHPLLKTNSFHYETPI